MKLKERAGSDLEARPSSELVRLSCSPQAQSHAAQGKIMREQQKGPLRPVRTKKAVSAGGEQSQDATETRGHRVKVLFHFVGPYHQRPEDPLLKLLSTVRVTCLGLRPDVECCGVEEHVWVGSGLTAHYGTIAGGGEGREHAGGCSHGSGQPGGLDGSRCGSVFPSVPGGAAQTQTLLRSAGESRGRGLGGDQGRPPRRARLSPRAWRMLRLGAPFTWAPHTTSMPQTQKQSGKPYCVCCPGFPSWVLRMLITMLASLTREWGKAEERA